MHLPTAVKLYVFCRKLLTFYVIGLFVRSQWTSYGSTYNVANGHECLTAHVGLSQHICQRMYIKIPYSLANIWLELMLAAIVFPSNSCAIHTHYKCDWSAPNMSMTRRWRSDWAYVTAQSVRTKPCIIHYPFATISETENKPNPCHMHRSGFFFLHGIINEIIKGVSMCHVRSSDGGNMRCRYLHWTQNPNTFALFIVDPPLLIFAAID